MSLCSSDTVVGVNRDISGYTASGNGVCSAGGCRVDSDGGQHDVAHNRVPMLMFLLAAYQNPTKTTMVLMYGKYYVRLHTQ